MGFSIGYCYSSPPDYYMTMFQFESTVYRFSHYSREVARWSFKINDKKLIIGGSMYSEYSPKDIHKNNIERNILDNWERSYDLKKVDSLISILNKGKEWTLIAQQNNLESYEKKINCLGADICIYFKFQDKKGYVSIKSTAWKYTLELKCENDYNSKDSVDTLISAFDNYKERTTEHKKQQDYLYRNHLENENKLKEQKEKIDRLFK